MKTIAFKVIVFRKLIYVHIHTVHYCFEIDFNLHLLRIFSVKKFEFCTKKDILHVKDTVRDTVLQSKCEKQVYFLLQSKTSEHYFPVSIHTYKTAKPVTMDFWHQRAGYVNRKDLTQLKNIT